MASLFGAETTQVGDIPTSTTVQQPIEDRSEVYGLRGTVGAIETASNAIAGLIKNVKASQGNAAISSYVNKSLNIARAVDQGLDYNEGRMRMRNLLQQSINNNPGVANEILSAHKTLLGTTGMAKIVDTGTPQQQMKEDLIRDAYDNGFIKGPADEEEGLQNYLNDLEMDRKANDLKERVARQQSQVNLDKSQLELEEKKNKLEAQNIVLGKVNTSLPLFSNKLSEIINEWEVGGDHVAAKAKIDGLWAQAQAAAGPSAGNEFIKQAMSPLETLKNSALDVVSGRINAEGYENQVKSAKNHTMFNLLKDPDMRNLTAVGEILKHHPDLMRVATSGIAQRKVNALFEPKKEGVNPNKSVPSLIGGEGEEKEANRSALKVSKRVVSESLSKSKKEIGAALDDEGVPHVEQARKAAIDSVSNTIRSVSKFGEDADSPADFNDVVEYFADPEVGKFISENVDELPPDVIKKASEAFEANYSDEVVSTIVRESENRFIKGENIVLAYEEGRGAYFKVGNTDELAKGGGSVISAAESSALGSKIRSLNSEVAPVVNNLIRAGAALSGHQDFEKVFNENFSGLLGVKDELEGKSGEMAPNEVKAEEALPDVKQKPEEKDLMDQVEERLPFNEEVMGNQQEVVDEQEPPKGRINLFGEEAPEGEFDVEYNARESIARAELGEDRQGSYNETLGYGKFVDGSPELTSMTVGEIKELQSEMLKHPENTFNSSAVGRYQIVQRTLNSLQKELGFDDSQVFDEDFQDQLGNALLKRRGSEAFRKGEISEASFKKRLMNEWQGLEKDPKALKEIVDAYKGGVKVADGTTEEEVVKTAAGIDKDKVKATVEELEISDLEPRGFINEETDEFEEVVALSALPKSPPKKTTENVGKNKLPIFWKPHVDQKVKQEVKDKWAAVQDEFGEQIKIQSGYRGRVRNRKAGGARKSQHIHGNAIDIDTKHLSRAEKLKLIKIAYEKGFRGFGVYNNNIHLDIGSPRYWGALS